MKNVLYTMNKHLFCVLGCFTLFSLCQNLQAQSKTNKEDVLYLKNGWVLRGTVTKIPGDSISIITGDRNRYTFREAEVERVSTEQRKWSDAEYRNHGFGHFTEIGALASTRNRPDNVTTAAFSFQTVNGYHFGPRLFTGIGIAADLYATQTTIPVFASMRANITTSGIFVPYFFMDGGYGFDITSSTTTISYEGGPMFATGIGFKIRFSRVAGFHVNFGYRMQQGATVESGIRSRYTNNRIALRAGFYL
jgi:hypothetical protein